ncbi:DNA/RNA-binding domain E.t1.c1-type, partial [Penicillium chrysogenum]
IGNSSIDDQNYSYYSDAGGEPQGMIKQLRIHPVTEESVLRSIGNKHNQRPNYHSVSGKRLSRYTEHYFINTITFSSPPNTYQLVLFSKS